MEITEDYVHFDTAKLLKQKGFAVPVRTFYNPKYRGEKVSNGTALINYNADPQDGSVLCSSPTLQMAMKYIRVKYGILAIIQPKTCYDGVVVYYWVYYQNGKLFAVNNYSETYEKCEEDFIKYCLINIIK